MHGDKERKEQFCDSIAFVSANRRCMQHFITEVQKCKCNLHGDLEVLKECVSKAYKRWKEPVYLALADSLDCGVPELLTFMRNHHNGGSEDIVIQQNEFTVNLLAFSQAGTINAQVVNNECRIVAPKGCVLHLLNELCHHAIPLEAHEELNAWRIVSLSVETNKGHYHERQLAAEAIMFNPTIYQVLSEKFGRELQPVDCASGKMFLYEAVIADF